MRHALLALALLIPILELNAQDADTLPAFEVASIKQNIEGDIRLSNNWQVTPGRTNFHNSQVVVLIAEAFGDVTLLVERAPEWTRSDRYDVVALYPAETSPAARRLMLRALLMDRFKLRAHLETREVPIYSLVLARSDRRLGPKLQPGNALCAPTANATPPPSCRREAGFGFIRRDYTDMAAVARLLSIIPVVGRRVVDNTGLTDSYSVDLKFAPTQAATDPDVPSVFTALQEQLGLKLESTRGPVEVLVIDSVERPTPD